MEKQPNQDNRELLATAKRSLGEAAAKLEVSAILTRTILGRLNGLPDEEDTRAIALGMFAAKIGNLTDMSVGATAGFDQAKAAFDELAGGEGTA